MNQEQIREEYLSIYKTLEKILVDIETEVSGFVEIKRIKNIDKIASRVKGLNSYVDKAFREYDGKLKYSNPIKEIQDILGVRIVGYYRENIDEISRQVNEYFREVEEKTVVSDSVRDFGYEGKHFILFIPPHIINKYHDNPLNPIFFELQVLTLFQHAWAIGEHGIGYKPGMKISDLTSRKLAFLSAQAWGADQILDELYKKKLNGEEI